MTLRPVLALALSLMCASLAAGAADMIDIGGVQVSIGDDKAPTLTALRAVYDVEEIRTNTYVVYKDNPSEHTVGVIQFRDDALVWASRDVGAFEGDAVRKFANALFDLLTKAGPEARTPIRITTEVNAMRPLSFGSIALEFPGRKIMVDIGFDGQVTDAAIEEVVYAEENSETGAAADVTECPPADIANCDDAAGRKAASGGGQNLTVTATAE